MIVGNSQTAARTRHVALRGALHRGRAALGAADDPQQPLAERGLIIVILTSSNSNSSNNNNNNT